MTTASNDAATSQEATNHALSNTPSVRAASRKNRVFVFRSFLWETYGNPNDGGTSYLRQGDVILDVAGGKGDLSWLFLNVDGISSVVVDPRNLSSTNHLIRSVHWLKDRPEEARQRAIPNLPTTQPLAALLPQLLERRETRLQEAQLISQDPEYLEPRHLKIKLNNDLVEALRQAKEEQTGEGSWRSFWDQMKENNTTRSPAASEEACFLPESERKDSTITAPIQDASEAWRVFQAIKLIVGFHPDQATEPCLDLAELLRVPLCIVPCCVFPSEFPDRKVAIQQDSGEVAMIPVRKYSLFLQYLQHKQPKLRSAKLAFHYTGTPLKNVALFTLPDDLR